MINLFSPPENRDATLYARYRALYELGVTDQYSRESRLFNPHQSFYTDKYFTHTINILYNEYKNPSVVMQCFAKREGIVAGLYEALGMLRDVPTCEIQTMIDGDAVTPFMPVLKITAPYREFGHLETPLLGVLARRSLVATNAKRVVESANGKPVIFMGARHDDWRVQAPDGYAARLGGMSSCSTDANGSWIGELGIGTIPHALIACFYGKVADATCAFARYQKSQRSDARVVALVDYNNDCLSDAVHTAHAMQSEFGSGHLWGVRLDTSENMVDRYFLRQSMGYPSMGNFKPTGVNVPLVQAVRHALDDAGFPEVKIIVSGGFTPQKIREFETVNAPVDAYGVGSSVLGHGSGNDGLLTGFDYTADIVAIRYPDGTLNPEAKDGRWEYQNDQLITVDRERLYERT